MIRTLALLFIFGGELSAAPDLWTYWIQPCSAELAQSTRCEASDPELARWALEAWARASDRHLAVQPSDRANEARMRIFWAGGSTHLYGETRPIDVKGERGAELYILPDMAALGEQLAAAGAGDKLYRDTIVYLTCLHESGHALGLAHNRNFEDIMYSFQYGGDIVEYFARYRRKLKTRDDIRRNSGLSPENAKLVIAGR